MTNQSLSFDNGFYSNILYDYFIYTRCPEKRESNRNRNLISNLPYVIFSFSLLRALRGIENVTCILYSPLFYSALSLRRIRENRKDNNIGIHQVSDSNLSNVTKLGFN